MMVAIAMGGYLSGFEVGMGNCGAMMISNMLFPDAATVF